MDYAIIYQQIKGVRNGILDTVLTAYKFVKTIFSINSLRKESIPFFRLKPYAGGGTLP